MDKPPTPNYVALQNANVEIRKHVDPPQSGDIIDATAAALDLYPKRDEHVRAVEAAEKAWSKCATNLEDPDTPATVLEKDYSALRKAEAAAVASSDAVRDYFDATDILEEVTSANEADALEALEHIARARACGERISLRSSAAGRLRDSNGAKRWTPHGGTIRLPGGESLANATTGFESYLPKPDPVHVYPAAMRLLQEGKDAETVDGQPLAFEEADALFRKGLLSVTYGKPFGAMS